MLSILAFAGIQLVVLLSFISMTAISVAFPNITAYFNASLVLAGWVLSIYQLIAACSMVLMGKVGDVIGRKNTFLICSGLFVLGSLFAALAPNIELLIVARFIQSIGAGGFVPNAVGLIVEMFPRHRQQLIGVSMSVNSAGGIIGPNIGGWLVTSYGWQAIFWFNVPIVLLAIIPLFFLLKSEQRKRVPIDFAGAGYFSAFLFIFMVGLSQAAHSDNGVGWLVTALLFAACIGFLIIFIRHELKTPDPIINLELLRLKPFMAANIYNFVYGACLLGFTSFIPLYAVSVYGMTTLQSGFVLMVRSIGFIVASMVSSYFLVKWGYRKPMLLGSIIASACILLFGFEFANVNIMGTAISPLVLLSALTLVLGIGMGVSSPASSNACLGLMPQRASTITGIRGMFRNSGGAISIAITTMIIQYVGNISLGFTVVFIATGLIILLTIPFIFAMPDKDSCTM